MDDRATQKCLILYTDFYLITLNNIQIKLNYLLSIQSFASSVNLYHVDCGNGVNSNIVCLAISCSEKSSSNGRHPDKHKYATTPIENRSALLP